MTVIIQRRQVLCPYLVDVLALELGDELLETLSVWVDADGLEEFGDVFGARTVVATEAEEEVCSEAIEMVRMVRCWNFAEPKHTASF